MKIVVNEIETLEWLELMLATELFDNDFEINVINPLAQQLYAEMVGLT